MKKYLEVKAPNFDVEVRGVMNKINYNIMIPNGFPKRPPYIRIVKPAKQSMVHNLYQSLKSPTD